MKVIFFSLLSLTGLATGFNQLHLKPIKDIESATLHYMTPLGADSRAVLLLFPGCNGNGKILIEQTEWIHFAVSNKMELASMSFISKVADLKNGKGYYYADQGSGDLLLKGIETVYGNDKPLILYGFSGGAHFVSRFAEWKPERVYCWCSYSAAWWTQPKCSSHSPPGIVACGGGDYRLGASLSYFKQGRSLNKPWLWVSSPYIGHEHDFSLDDFFRKYVSCLLNSHKDSAGFWVDVEKCERAGPGLKSLHKTGIGWLPDERLLPDWQNLMKVNHDGN